MNLLKVAQGLMIGTIFFIGIFSFLDVLGTKADAQQALITQGHFQMLTWQQEGLGHGVYILNSQTGSVSIVNNEGPVKILGTAK